MTKEELEAKIKEFWEWKEELLISAGYWERDKNAATGWVWNDQWGESNWEYVLDKDECPVGSNIAQVLTGTGCWKWRCPFCGKKFEE